MGPAWSGPCLVRRQRQRLLYGRARSRRQPRDDPLLPGAHECKGDVPALNEKRDGSLRIDDAALFGDERQYFGVLCNNDEPNSRRSHGSHVSLSGSKSRRRGHSWRHQTRIELATEIMALFVSNNAVPRADLPALFQGLHSALKRLADGGEIAPAAIDPPAPAV